MATRLPVFLNFTYMMSAFTALSRRRRYQSGPAEKKAWQKRIDKLTDHYIICGIGRVGTNVAHELSVTNALVRDHRHQPAQNRRIPRAPP